MTYDDEIKKELKNMLGRKVRFFDYRWYSYLPFNILRNLSVQTINKFKGDPSIKIGNRNCKIKPIMEINREFVELLGLYVAEGCIRHDRKKNSGAAVFSYGKDEWSLIDHTYSVCEKVFPGHPPALNKAHETAWNVYLYADFIALLFKDVFKAGFSSLTKRVPEIVFNLSPELRERFLIAYLAGDGHPSSEFSAYLVGGYSPSVEKTRKYAFNTVSEELAVGLQYLLSSLGKSYSVRRIEPMCLDKTHFIISKNTAYSFDFYWNCNSSYVKRVPYDEFIEECSNGGAIRAFRHGQTGISIDKLSTLVKNKQAVLKGDGDKLLKSDLGVVKQT